MSRDLNHHRNRHARPEFPTPTACQPPQTPRSDRWTPDFAGALTGTGIPVPLGRPIGDLDKAVDDVYKELNKHEAENGKQVLGEAGNEASSSNSILDLGAPGLRYFEYFGPLYQKCVVGTEICRDKACQLYDEQRDMNLGVLRTDSAILTKGAAKLSEEITTQRNAWSTVDQL